LETVEPSARQVFAVQVSRQPTVPQTAAGTRRQFGVAEFALAQPLSTRVNDGGWVAEAIAPAIESGSLPSPGVRRIDSIATLAPVAKAGMVKDRSDSDLHTALPSAEAPAAPVAPVLQFDRAPVFLAPQASEQAGSAAPQTGLWARLDSFDAGAGPGEARPATVMTEAAVQLTSPDGERVAVRVAGAGAGFEVRVMAEDRQTHRALLGGLGDLAARVQELSLGDVTTTARPGDGAEAGTGHRQTPLEWLRLRRPRRTAGPAFEEPTNLSGAAKED
jgi:hypothetical protein